MKPIETVGERRKVAWKKVSGPSYRLDAMGLAIKRLDGTTLVPDTNEILHGVDYPLLDELIADIYVDPELFELDDPRMFLEN